MLCTSQQFEIMYFGPYFSKWPPIIFCYRHLVRVGKLHLDIKVYVNYSNLNVGPLVPNFQYGHKFKFVFTILIVMKNYPKFSKWPPI